MNSDQSPLNSKELTIVEANPEFRRVFGDAKTIADFFRQHYKKHLEALFASVPNGDAFLRHLLRYYEPWPNWVLRIAAEVWSVHLPTVKKAVIHDCFALVHFFVFEMRIDGSGLAEVPKLPEIDMNVVGAIIGHGLAMSDHIQSMADYALKMGFISCEQHAEYIGRTSYEHFQAEMKPILDQFFENQPKRYVELWEAIVRAKDRTFDKQGRIKETTSTRVYETILRDWIEIEELSGPTALCEYLKPVLDGSENDPEKRLDRVKKICRRMGIQFKPVVKGQTRPPTLSLPPADRI